MIIFKFSGYTTTPWIAYTISKTGDNLPSTIEGKKVTWSFVEEIDTTNPLSTFNKNWLKEIEEHGFYIPNPTIEWGEERSEKI